MIKTDKQLFGRIGIIVGIFIVLVVIAYFVITGSRSSAIKYLSTNAFVIVSDFSSYPTALLKAWETHLKQLDEGQDVSVLTFTYSGSNYNIQDGSKK